MSDAPTAMWRALGGVIVVFMLSPLLLLVLFAFSDKTLLSFPITGLTLDWFIKIFNTAKFWAAFDNSMIVTGTVGLVSTVSAPWRRSLSPVSPNESPAWR